MEMTWEGKAFFLLKMKIAKKKKRNRTEKCRACAQLMLLHEPC
jgi:hypothetical protein